MPKDGGALSRSLSDALIWHLEHSLGQVAETATVSDWRKALALAARERIMPVWHASRQRAQEAGAKRVYYLSMEFLVGRLIEDGLVNLRLLDEAHKALADVGLDPEVILHDEPDAALGNGGLGRLAACFLESLSTLGVPAMGYGIRYEHGLFRQSFEDGRQIETPETWLADGAPWEFQRPSVRFGVGFGGSVHAEGNQSTWHPAYGIDAMAFDVPVVGWQGRWANTLRLWSGKASPGFDFGRFNAGDYLGATDGEAQARTISRVLYPDDTSHTGKELRLKQEYFFSAASLADILRRFEAETGDLRQLPKKVAIQLNDTHPAIAGPELVRLLHDEKGFGFDEACAIARETLSYTNHTLLPEALESWDEGLFGHLLPRHLQIIDRIDADHAKAKPGRGVSLRAHNSVRMGELSFVMAHKVNGVSALHTDLMQSTVFEDLAGLHPERVVNQTNGVTPRRWLLNCNPGLAGLVSSRIGDDWIGDLEQLAELEEHLDAEFLAAFAAVKRGNKERLAAFVADELGETLNPDHLFDVQIKRIHEYKRQHLNILETIALWQDMRAHPEKDWTPRVKLFAGKAAPGYHFAKDIIRLINDAARVMNEDPVTKDRLKVLFLPNYNVTLAERLIPAADLSEQISTAGKEASGTGNMKFALNGALTIGTLDGANVEIREHVGAENFFLFGMTAEEVDERRALPDHAAQAIAEDARLDRALSAVAEGIFSLDEPERYKGIADNLRHHDYFTVCSDFTSYWTAQRDVDAAFKDREEWMRRAALNTARSGWFSSDRTIRGYMADIWDAKPII